MQAYEKYKYIYITSGCRCPAVPLFAYGIRRRAFAHAGRQVRQCGSGRTMCSEVAYGDYHCMPR